MSTLTYKGYTGTVEYSTDEPVFLYGKLAGIRDLITYEGTNITELEQAFKFSVDDYLQGSIVLGMEPNRPDHKDRLSIPTPVPTTQSPMPIFTPNRNHWGNVGSTLSEQSYNIAANA